ncbi:MAG: AAA family ATPase [Pseudomonadota bacterium]|nr:AAA family ATPase [Pseudomonadota bacterium]
MLQRLYIHNFKCFQNFELKPEGKHSSLLIGKNGAGKTSIAKALLVFQGIGRGINRVGHLIDLRDFLSAQTGLPMRFELEVLIQEKKYHYSLALELPEKFKELRVVEEWLEVEGEPVYVRELAQVSLRKVNGTSGDARFLMDWHLISLPLIQVQSENDPVHIFKTWLAQMVVLAPIPQLMLGESTEESLWPTTRGGNVVDWLAGLLGQYPAAYTAITSYLSEVMPDLKYFRYEPLGKESKRLVVHYAEEAGSLSLNFDELSDGEKCFFLCSIIVAANQTYGPIFCFWDEPDNYLSLAEVGHFILHLRRAFEQNGQIIMTTHNEEAIRKFSNENTWVLSRRSHMEPAQLRPLTELALNSDVIQSLLCGEL